MKKVLVRFLYCDNEAAQASDNQRDETSDSLDMR